MINNIMTQQKQSPATTPIHGVMPGSMQRSTINQLTKVIN